MIKLDSTFKPVLPSARAKEYVSTELRPLLKKNDMLTVRKYLQDCLDYITDEEEPQVREWLIYHLKDNYFKDCTEIFRYEFCLVRGILGLSIPNGVTVIRAGAFWECEDLLAIEIPKSVRTIEMEAFKYCPLKRVVIPEGVTTISEQAFFGCSNLTSVSIPNSVKRIERLTFNGCHRLRDVYIPDGVEYIGPLAFGNCDMLGYVQVPKYTTVDDTAFDKSVTIKRY